MKIISTSDWHLGNLFHGNDRLPEHKHFLTWLLAQIKKQQPDALLIAGDVFDNANPSAASQSLYYEFLADATQICPDLQIIITAGNHDSASRIEAPRPLLMRHKVQIRGNIRRNWHQEDNVGSWEIDYNDLMIPLQGRDGVEAIVLAVPYLRSDIVQNHNYSQGVNDFLRTLTRQARALYPDRKLIMMAHMYAKGSEISTHDPSEKIIIGGQEEVNMEGWTDHPDYLTCGHIHKRQHIWNTDWARYTGSILPMSFAEKDYVHGVDLITITQDHRPRVEQLEYTPQHKLQILSSDDIELSHKKLLKLIDQELPDKTDGELDEHYVYVVLKTKLDHISPDEIKELEARVAQKNAVLCKIQKLITNLNLTTISGGQKITSIDDILNRDPLETIRETYAVKFGDQKIMSDSQEQMLRELLNSIKYENHD